jgi:hypothetical protein
VSEGDLYASQSSLFHVPHYLLMSQKHGFGPQLKIESTRFPGTAEEHCGISERFSTFCITHLMTEFFKKEMQAQHIKNKAPLFPRSVFLQLCILAVY